MYNNIMMLTHIISETYAGSDRRQDPKSKDRRNSDRRTTVVVVYDENGELSKKRGELVDIEV